MSGKDTHPEPGRISAAGGTSSPKTDPPGGLPSKKAFSELATRGAEEIQDHLSLVARTQVRIRSLLQTSIEELERAQRLETLTRLIAGGGPESDGFRPGPARAEESPDDHPGAFLDCEIRTLKKMLRLVGPPTPPAGEPGGMDAEAPTSPLPLTSIENEAEPETTRKVLLIDPDAGTVRVLRYFLEKENYEVIVCSNGSEGLQRAMKEKPDVIFLDVLLPGMDGYQVLARLKKNERTAAIPVFVLSVLAQEVDILKAIEGGAEDYFTKPFSPPIIIAKLRRSPKARHG
jgi:CheY-like chemotaxis protein